jgi:hypothetical protein
VVSDAMDAKEVYEMHNGAYHKYPYDRFKINLKNLRQAINDLQKAASEDEIALENMIQEWPIEDDSPTTYPPWHNSHARMLLLRDIEQGEIDGHQPSIVWHSRLEYMEYPLKVFRDHLNKEKTKPTIKAYWEHQRELKKKKKQEEMTFHTGD